jgi:alpha-glucosidase
MQPLVQSTAETPQGPLTLRIYAGDDCHGSLYTDDGQSFAYQRGVFLRLNFTCAVTPQGIRIAISSRQGSYVPWWKELRLEVYGWSPAQRAVLVDGRSASLPIENGNNFVAVTVPDSGQGTTVELQ